MSSDKPSDRKLEKVADELCDQIKRGTAPWQKPWKPGKLAKPIIWRQPMAKKSGNEDYIKRVADEIIEQIKRGAAPWQKPWKPGERCTPENFSTGKSYTGGNSLYLMSRGLRQGFDDNRWGTYKQIAAAKGQVRKGERGTQVLFFSDRKKEAVKDLEGKPVKDQEGKQVYQERKRAYPAIRTYTVFNVEQADKLKLPPRSVAAKPEWETHDKADQVIQAGGAKVQHVEGDRAFYRIAEDKIVLPERDQFPTATAYYQTALHESGHSTGHPDRMDRETLKNGLEKGFGSPEYAREELRAEISAMMTGEKVGVGHDPQRGAAYVKNWVAVLEKDPMEIHRAAREAQRMTDYLIDRAKERKRLSPDKEKAAAPAHKYSPSPGPQINIIPTHAPQQGKELDRDSGPSR